MSDGGANISAGIFLLLLLVFVLKFQIISVYINWFCVQSYLCLFRVDGINVLLLLCWGFDHTLVYDFSDLDLVRYLDTYLSCFPMFWLHYIFLLYLFAIHCDMKMCF